MKKYAAHGCAVVKGVLFIGFSIQIVLGIIWMCCNFFQIQDFGETDAVLYRWLYGLTGESPRIIYGIQLICAFLAGYYFLERLDSGRGKKDSISVKTFKIWRGLALLTIPFAMQCHLAILPYSFMASLFLMMLLCLVEIRRLLQKHFEGRKAAAAGRALVLAIVCAAGIVVLPKTVDAGEDSETSKGSFAAAMASRMAWPTVWNDFGYWPEELREITQDVVWETAFCPGNMELLQDAIENSVGVEAAKAYDWQIAKIGWTMHAPMIIRQIGWDALGYLVSPVIFQLQMEGEAYDSYAGRNYEIMRGNSPVLTRYYVDYGSWWFVCCLVLALCLAMLQTVYAGAIQWKKIVVSAVIYIVPVGVLVCLYTMRGAGLMDYKCTVAVNILWLIWALWLMGRRIVCDISDEKKI